MKIGDLVQVKSMYYEDEAESYRQIYPYLTEIGVVIETSKYGQRFMCNVHFPSGVRHISDSDFLAVVA